MQSRRSAVAPTVDRVLEAIKDSDLGPGRCHDLAVAVSEALSNAAVHGNRLHADSSVRVTVEVTPGAQVVVEVADSGQGFDVDALADPTHPSHILDPAGRGVFLMRRLVDRVEYNETGNHVRLTMRRRPRRRSSDH